MRRKTRVWSNPVPLAIPRIPRFRRGRGTAPGFSAWWVGLVATLVLVALIGCGTNIDALAAQTGNAAATSVLDLLLTDFANQVADAFDQNALEPSEDGGDGDGGDGGDGGNGGGGPAGQQVFESKGCGACHGANAEGGSAPALAGADQSAALEERFGGGASHYGSTLTDQEIADVAEWLAGSGGNGGGGGGADGAALFAQDCAACHGADGASGFAPNISGFTAGDLSAGLQSATHSSMSLTDEEVAAVAAFLGG
ncbi:MAG: cytochrome c [Planctomycetota bacterium]